MTGTRRSALVAVAMLAALGSGSLAQQTVLETRAPAQEQDPRFAQAVKEWTTKPEFISPLVDHLPKSATVPQPKDVLGYDIGAPKKLTYYADIVNYYRALAAKSPRVKVQSIGKTDEGRDYVVVYVSSEDNIRSLEQYRRSLNQLADPRTLSEAQAREIIAKAKPVYHLMGGLHSAETGHSEMLMELAYRLAVEDSALIKQIRDNLIVTITPVAEPDGRDRYVDWYYRHLVDVDDENARVAGPPYWGKYVLHDNNRDINYSQVTMRALLDWYMQWKAPIVHELHESIPFLYTYSGQAPQNPNFDPILYGEMPWFANFEMAQMTKYGMPGVWTHGFMDSWSPGYLGSMAYNHNAMMRMYEVFNNGGATTMKRTIARDDPFGGRGGRGSQTTREWYRPLPPYKEVVWSMRNNINYAETGVLTGLQLASTFPTIVLENFYLKSLHSVEMGRKEAPYAYVIPGGQPDQTRVAFVVNILRLQGVEVGRTTAELKLKDGVFPAGSFIIKGGQPYWRLAKILLEKQNYPDASLQTYDDSGWTMGLMAQVDVKEVGDKAALDAAAEPVKEYKPAGTVAGAGAVVAVAHNGSNNLITLRYRLKDLNVRAAEKAFTAGGREFPAGSLVIDAGSSGDRVRKEIESLGLLAAGLSSAPDVPMHELDMPRIAVYSTWGSTQDPGWLRHAFDKFEVPYDLIYKERVRQGHLRGDYDVILVPSQGFNAKALVYDIPMKGKPLAYTKTDKYKNLGMYGESEDIRGGMGLEGVLEFQKFLDEGGLLITLGTASYFPPEFGVVDDVNASRTSPQFYAPRPIVEAEILKPEHPIFYGYTKTKIPVKYVNGPLLQVSEQERERATLMRYTGGEPGVLSGLMRNPNEIKMRPAIVDLPLGDPKDGPGAAHGRVLLFATNPIYRWQNWGEFNMVFNALMNYNDLPAATDAKKPQTTATR